MRHFIVAEPSYIADRLVAAGSRITDAWLNGAEPGTNLIETDEAGVPKDSADIARLLAAGTNLGPVEVAPVSPHAPNPTAPQAIPGQTAGSVQLAGDREYVPAAGVESNEAASARVERLKAELAAAEEAASRLASAAPEDLQPEPPRRVETPLQPIPVVLVDPAQAGQDGQQGSGSGDQQPEPGPLDGSIASLTTHLEGVTDAAEIDRLIAAEKGGKSRTGALEALNARKSAIAAG